MCVALRSSVQVYVYGRLFEPLSGPSCPPPRQLRFESYTRRPTNGTSQPHRAHSIFGSSRVYSPHTLFRLILIGTLPTTIRLERQSHYRLRLSIMRKYMVALLLSTFAAAWKFSLPPSLTGVGMPCSSLFSHDMHDMPARRS